jgi:hypothetical protein
VRIVRWGRASLVEGGCGRVRDPLKHSGEGLTAVDVADEGKRSVDGLLALVDAAGNSVRKGVSQTDALGADASPEALHADASEVAG